MERLRKYGEPPYHVVLVHGGPGAPGTMGPFAKELSTKYSVLEPFQSKDSIESQCDELKSIIEENESKLPVVLIGHSWGAWLSYIFASKYPQIVKKLILVSCGAFLHEYVSQMNRERKNRLREDENIRVAELFNRLVSNKTGNKGRVLKEFGELMMKADSYCPISIENEALDFQVDVFNNCMAELIRIRISKELLNYGKEILCPVIALHGEYDSHPYEGVEIPLSQVIKEFKFILLDQCGHTPWNEMYAREDFYKIIFNEIGENGDE